MKHLKTFENLIDILKKEGIKKYLVIPSGPNHLYILEKINIDDRVIVTKHIYTFNKGLNKLINLDDDPDPTYNREYRLPLSMPDKTIVYQSDNLDNVIENVKLLVNSQKYNL